MRLNRRNFFFAASGALAYASSPLVLKRAGIAGEEPIRVGTILDVTGVITQYGLPPSRAITMAIEEINAAGGLLGRPVEQYFYDSQSNNQFNAQYTTQALVRDKVDVIQGGLTSSSREVMRPIVQKFGGLLFYNSLYEGGVCDRRHVCCALVPSQQLQTSMSYVMNELGGKRGYILVADYNYGHIVSRWMKKFIEQAGGEVLGTEYIPLDVTNFAPHIARIQAAKPDVVWDGLVGSFHIAYYRQFEATIGKKNMIVASNTFGTGLQQLQLSPDEGEGIVVANAFFDDLPTENAANFVRSYQEFVGNNDYVGEYAEYGYRGLHLWANAVKKAGSADVDAVVEALDGTQFEAPGGLVTIDGQTNHCVMDVHLVRSNRNQSFDLIETFGQQQPTGTQSVCNLFENPDDTTQYDPSV